MQPMALYKPVQIISASAEDYNMNLFTSSKSDADIFVSSALYSYQLHVVASLMVWKKVPVSDNTGKLITFCGGCSSP